VSITKLYRVYVRQRVRFTTGTDTSVIESVKPTETEGQSIERDITDYVAGYKLPRSRETLSAECVLKIISPGGILNPENHKSPYNLSPLDGVTFTPIFAEGNEIIIYRIKSPADLSNRANWISRFRGVIRATAFGTDAGQDTLEVTAGDILSRATKATITGSFSPVVRTSSALPANSFYTQATLNDALTKMRNTSSVSWVSDTYNTQATPQETGEITSDTLARLIYWDRDDVYYSHGKAIGKSPRFKKDTGESPEAVMPYPAVTSETARALYLLGGPSWLVDAGTVTKDATRPFSDKLGSIKLVNATLRHTGRKLPVNSNSQVRFRYRIEDSSSVEVKIVRRAWNPATQAFDSTWDAKADRVVLDVTFTGATAFNAANLGGTILNSPAGGTYEFRLADIAIGAIDPAYGYDTNDGMWVVYDTQITSTGTVWIDQPRWEFTIIDRDATTGNAVLRETNIMNMSTLERWTTEDGIVYVDPYAEHRSLQPKNLRVVMRRLRAPYFAGTDSGYGPVHLKNRNLPEDFLYEQELVEGQDYEVLADKGGIQLSSAMTRIEIFVAHGFNDLASSGHMEASNMLTFLFQKGAGIPNVSMEPTGIILNRIELGVKTTTTVMSAVQDLLKQLPGNFHIYADGDDTVIGHYVQQEGSPRIFNPIIQAPINPTDSTKFQDKPEFWYCATNLMPDGKETLASNLMSTVEYQNYFDAAHESHVTETTCPVLQMKMAPNAVGLVLRRAKAYKTVSDLGAAPSLTPKVQWEFDGATPLVSTIGGVTLTDGGSGFGLKTLSELLVEKL
jgi:hypothetical protein